MVNIRWLWVPLIGASAFPALPGNSNIGGVIGDLVRHFLSAGLVAIVPVAALRRRRKKSAEVVST